MALHKRSLRKLDEIIIIFLTWNPFLSDCNATVVPPGESMIHHNVHRK